MHTALLATRDRVGSVLEKAYSRSTSWLPPLVAARLDLLRPSYGASWGGPLNGQRDRRQIVRELARAIDFDKVIETGTYRGTSTEFFSAVFGVPVSTVEANPRYFTFSKRRLAVDSDVTVELGDSRSFLRDLAAQSDKNDRVFFYLDAHWEKDLPLAEELEIIASSWSHAVVMIDDFQVPGDGGYGYDVYGSGMALNEEYLPEAALRGWSIYYPATGSDRETGAKRGSCVLSSSALARRVDTPTLRLAHAF